MTVTEFTWTGGGGGNHSWSTPSNWSPSPSCSGCYPNDCQHNAVIPYQSGGWDIELVSEQIHLVDIAGDVDFTGTGSIPVLEVEELVLTGDHDVVITFTAATMKTMSCP
ncbi:MAG: hypothetical protein IT449_17405 [Phycisphaerales bacterium]|nr:hypothetical protein [Phycisphaerales bacterium]